VCFPSNTRTYLAKSIDEVSIVNSAIFPDIKLFRHLVNFIAAYRWPNFLWQTSAEEKKTPLWDWNIEKLKTGSNLFNASFSKDDFYLAWLRSLTNASISPEAVKMEFERRNKSKRLKKIETESDQISIRT
jgi:hypothetical protein